MPQFCGFIKDAKYNAQLTAPLQNYVLDNADGDRDFIAFKTYKQTSLDASRRAAHREIQVSHALEVAFDQKLFGRGVFFCN